jgi:hypothetical protein
VFLGLFFLLSVPLPPPFFVCVKLLKFFHSSRVGLGNQAIQAMRDGILQAVEPYVEVECTEAFEVKKLILSLFYLLGILFLFNAQFSFLIFPPKIVFSLFPSFLASVVVVVVGNRL